VYVEGLVDAAKTADTFKDKARAVKYRRAIDQAVRFIMQLRFKPEECYYVQSMHDVLGGVRNAPASPTIRIDNMQHALSALLGAREICSGSQPK
jgi:hypothetical protein